MNSLVIILLGLIFITSGQLVARADVEQAHRIQYVNDDL
jgi:hypothetical protein